MKFLFDFDDSLFKRGTKIMFIRPDFLLRFSDTLFPFPLTLPVPPFFVLHFVSCVCSRVPGPTNSTFSCVPPTPVPEPATHPEPSTHTWATAAGDGTGRLSSDEGDAETAEDGERPSFHCSNHHPQPLGVSIIPKYDIFFLKNPISAK